MCNGSVRSYKGVCTTCRGLCRRTEPFARLTEGAVRSDIPLCNSCSGLGKFPQATGKRATSGGDFAGQMHAIPRARRNLSVQRKRCGEFVASASPTVRVFLASRNLQTTIHRMLQPRENPHGILFDRTFGEAGGELKEETKPSEPHDQRRIAVPRERVRKERSVIEPVRSQLLNGNAVPQQSPRLADTSAYLGKNRSHSTLDSASVARFSLQQQSTASLLLSKHGLSARPIADSFFRSKQREPN